MIRLVGVVFVVAAVLAAWFWLGRGTAPVPETAFQALSAPHAAAPVVPTVSPQVPQPAPPRDLVSPEPVVRQATAEPLDMEERRSLVAVKREQIRELMAQLPAV